MPCAAPQHDAHRPVFARGQEQRAVSPVREGEYARFDRHAVRAVERRERCVFEIVRVNAQPREGFVGAAAIGQQRIRSPAHAVAYGQLFALLKRAVVVGDDVQPDVFAAVDFAFGGGGRGDQQQRAEQRGRFESVHTNIPPGDD